MSRYDGKYSKLREDPQCNSCGKEKSDQVKLSRCSRCKLVWYCCLACQKSDYAQHKRHCREIESLQANMETQAEELKEYSQWGEEPHNLFETEVGHFWLVLETRDYMRARMDLCLKQEILAKQVQTRDAWAVVLNHHLEMLRLCAGDNLGLRFPTPFLLLRLNRDDDAYCFCRHWLGSESSDPDHSETNEGDWIYPGEKNCRFRDIFREFGETGLSAYSDIALLLALAVIKMRLVAVYEPLLLEVSAFAATSRCKMLGPDEQAEVRKSIMGNPEEEQKLADQRRQLNELLDLLQSRNASVVPALLNPDPLLSLSSPAYYSPGSPSEARMVLGFAIDLWRDIPGADKLLEGRFGTATPSYPTDMRS